MDSDSDTACAVGCPIRRSRDQRLLASPPGLSQRATSFIASQCQGIHQMPFISRLSTTPNGKSQTALLQNCLPRTRLTSLLKTHVEHDPANLPPEPCDSVAGGPDVPASVTSLLASSRFNQQTRSQEHNDSSRLQIENFMPRHNRCLSFVPPIATKGWWR
jgi:hypothetical protein